MSTMTLEIPKEYGYVLASGVFTTLVGFWHGARIGGFRKAAGVAYPNHYATQAQIDAAKTDKEKEALYVFNCAQRAHGNFLENHTNNLALILIAGLKYPVAAAGLGFFWSVMRVLFAVGYTNPAKKDGKGRYLGLGHILGYLGLTGYALRTCWDFIQGA